MLASLNSRSRECWQQPLKRQAGVKVQALSPSSAQPLVLKASNMPPKVRAIDLQKGHATLRVAAKLATTVASNSTLVSGTLPRPAPSGCGLEVHVVVYVPDLKL